jgi:hypothetical protein
MCYIAKVDIFHCFSKVQEFQKVIFPECLFGGVVGSNVISKLTQVGRDWCQFVDRIPWKKVVGTSNGEK